MNNLVAYDEESDDDSPRRRSFEEHTKRRRSSEQKARSSSRSPSPSPRPRKDSELMFDDTEMYSNSAVNDDSPFVEPPPPARRAHPHSPSPLTRRTPLGLPHVSSQATLVSDYGDDDREDAFEQADREAHEGQSHSSSPSATAEPRPPERISQDEESEDDLDNEKMIDAMLEEAQNAPRDHVEGGTAPSTPRYGESPHSDTVETGEEKEEEASQTVEEVQIPPAPSKEVDPMLQGMIEGYFEKKHMYGRQLGESIVNRKEFRNPSCYESFIERFGLDEKGTNFASHIFDPHMFPDNCFYERLGDVQRKVTEDLQKRQSASAPKGTEPAKKIKTSH